MSWNDWARHQCGCNHVDTEHAKNVGRCSGTDSYGIRCRCGSFVMDENALEDEDARG